MLCVQECKFSCQCLQNPNYHWYVNQFNRIPTSRGTAILLKKTLLPYARSFTCISENLCYIQLSLTGSELVLVSYHAPTTGTLAASESYLELSSLVSELVSLRREFCLLGDFNARLGSVDRDDSNNLNIGNNLGHFESNGNGLLLKELAISFDLEMLTTKFGNCTRYTYQEIFVHSWTTLSNPFKVI